MEKSVYAAVRDIREGKTAMLYLVFHAQDAETVRWLSRELLARSLRDNPDATAEVVYHFMQTEPFSLAVAEAQGGDLFATRIVTVCMNFDYLTTAHKAAAEREFGPHLEALLHDPPLAPMVLATAGEKLDERKKWTKRLMNDPQVCVVNAGKWKREEWRHIVLESLGTGIHLTTAQIDVIVDRCGDSLGILHQELEKIKAYALDRQSVSEEELRELVPDNTESDVFAVVRLALNGQFIESYHAWNRLGRESMFSLLALLARQYRLVARVSEEAGKGYSDQQLATMLGVHPYACKVAREQSHQLHERECKRQLIELADLEYAVKSGRLSEQAATDFWFLSRVQRACR